VDITIDSWPMRLASSILEEEDPELEQLLGKLDQIADDMSIVHHLTKSFEAGMSAQT
jgi:hypothetical protein